MDDVALFDPKIPLYYVVNRTLPKDEATAVLDYLRITPVMCAIISDLLDGELALRLSNEVIRTNDDEHAREVANLISTDLQRPCLVLGEANFLDAVFKDGHIEGVAKQC
jgi:hypothetical protein